MAFQQTTLRLLTALLKLQARTWLGDEAAGVVAETLIGAEVQARLEAWLQGEEAQRRLQQAAQEAHRWLQEARNCPDEDLRRVFHDLTFGDLPAVQAQLAALPAAFDLSGLEGALRAAFDRDLPHLPEAQRAEGARLYAEALQLAVGRLRDYAVPVTLQMVQQVRAEQRAGFAETLRRLDHILARLEAGGPLPAPEAAALQEALRRGQVLVYGDVRGSVIIVGHGNTVTLPAARAQALTEQVTLPGALPPGSTLPFGRNAAFTGREAELRALAAALCPPEGDEAPPVVVTQAVAGLGGVGKTQLAVEFAYRYGYRFRGVHWLDLRDPAQLDEQIARNGEALGLRQAEGEGRDEFAGRVLRAWQAEGPRLVVLDNLEDLPAAREALRRLRHPHLRLLITARRSHWPHDLGVQVRPLAAFTPAESRAFLRRALPPERAADADLDALAARLGHLPLALELAARYLAAQPYLSVADYLARLEDLFDHRSMRGWKPEWGNPTDHDLSLWATFTLSWERVRGAAARRLFLLAGLLAPNEPIPAAVLQRAVEDPEALGEAVHELVNLALWQAGEGGPAVHPLLAEFARRLLKGEAGREAGAEAFLEALADLAVETNDEVDRTGDYTLFAPLLPHLRAAAAGAEDLAPPAAGRLWNSLGYHLYAVAAYAEARACYERALRLLEQHLGEEHPNVATLVNNLGLVLHDLDDLEGGRACYERALRIDEAAFGPHHPNVARDVNNLGLVLQDLGDLEGARACFERALRIFEQHLGQEHPNVATLVNNLGSVLKDLGDLEKARACFERALRIFEERLPPDHPHVRTVRHNLAGLPPSGEGD